MWSREGQARLVLLSLALAGFVLANPSCNPGKPGMLNVHLVCHTHDDVGWLKTVDQYYYGANNTIQRAGVQYILDSVVDALLKDSTKKFIYVESAFFFRWWNQQTEDMKNSVKGLVNRGQLEFINGGWSMNDEAATHYNAIIDQMTVGLVKLNDTFGEAGRPRVAWQIDPFGHSREQASLFAQMGFDSLFFGRLDHDDKNTRWANKTMEMVWKGSQNLGKDAWLFTGVLPNGYSPPSGFCFDILCSDEPIMDDPHLYGYNVDRKVADFISLAEKQAEGYASNHIIMTLGEDFNYQSADMWYTNLDKLIRYVNERQTNGSKVNVFYSTPSCYTDALHAANLTWPTKEDDFFPYASGNHSYWTGYFTSRPTIKGFVRKGNNILQVVKQVASLMGLGQDPRLETLKEAMAVLQHHDAVTGTEKQHVADDYSLRLSHGLSEVSKMVAEAFVKLQPPEAEELGGADVLFCPLLNISSCPTSESSHSFVVTVYNPLARPLLHYVRLPVPAGVAYKVIDYQGNAVEAQLVPLPESLFSLPGRNSAAKFELVFPAPDIPPLGYLQFHVQRSSSRRILKQLMSSVYMPRRDEPLEVVGENLAIGMDPHTGLLLSIGAVVPGEIKMVKVNQTFLYYQGMAGFNNKEKYRASGAYIFRPNGTEAHEVAEAAKLTIVKGPLLYEVHQTWSPWVSQVIRAYKQKMALEMEWLVGPIPVEDSIGREVINRVVWPDLTEGDTFYTDSNGREMLKRVKDYRPTWQLKNLESVAGNYYPVNSRLVLDNGTNFKAAILTDRSQGGSSLHPGQMELMVHRRLLHDDAFGVGEALNETQYGEGLVVRGKHFLLHSNFASAQCDFGCLHRTLGEELLLQPVLSFSPTSSSPHTWRKSFTTKWSGVTRSLPANVHLLTLEPWGEDRLLLRLENMYEAGESSTSGPATVELQGLFADWEILSAEETILSTNLPKKDESRLQWNVEDDATEQPPPQHHGPIRSGDPLTVSLNPMEIKTLILKVKKSSSRF